MGEICTSIYAQRENKRSMGECGVSLPISNVF